MTKVLLFSQKLYIMAEPLRQPLKTPQAEYTTDLRSVFSKASALFTDDPTTLVDACSRVAKTVANYTTNK
jgi:hypothetical protein